MFLLLRLQCLKALDIMEARNQGQSLDAGPTSAVTLPSTAAATRAVTTATTSTTTPGITATLTAANLAAVASTSGAPAGGDSSSTVTPAPGPVPAMIPVLTAPLSQNRQLLDRAAAVFVSDKFLFSSQALNMGSDFYLAAIVLLEKVSFVLIVFCFVGNVVNS